MKEALVRGDFHLLHDVLRKSLEAKRRMASRIVNGKIETLYEKALGAGADCAGISGRRLWRLHDISGRPDAQASRCGCVAQF